MGDLHSGSGAKNKTKFDNSQFHTCEMHAYIFVTTYVALVQLAQAVDLLWVVVGQRRAGC